MEAKLFSPKLHKCYFLYVHTQILSKVLILLYFVKPKRHSGNCCVSCFLTDETALRLGVKLDPNPNPGWKFVQVGIVKRLIWAESIFDTAQISLFIRELLSHRQEEKKNQKFRAIIGYILPSQQSSALVASTAYAAKCNCYFNIHAACMPYQAGLMQRCKTLHRSVVELQV